MWPTWNRERFEKGSSQGRDLPDDQRCIGLVPSFEGGKKRCGNPVPRSQYGQLGRVCKSCRRNQNSIRGIVTDRDNRSQYHEGWKPHRRGGRR